MPHCSLAIKISMAVININNVNKCGHEIEEVHVLDRLKNLQFYQYCFDPLAIQTAL